MPHIYSTNSADAHYCMYDNAPGGSPRAIVKSVLIKGGANIGGKGLITPLGVRTEVSEEDLEFLMNNEAFKRHVDKGHLVVSKAKKDADKVAADMVAGDKSSPQLVDKIAADTSKSLEQRNMQDGESTAQLKPKKAK